MPDLDFRKSFPAIDGVTQWYLREIVYCLEHYQEMTLEKAYSMVGTSDYLRAVLEDDPKFLRTEDPFYWAMALMHRGFWWRDEKIAYQYQDYMNQKRYPPSQHLRENE